MKRALALIALVVFAGCARGPILVSWGGGAWTPTATVLDEAIASIRETFLAEASRAEVLYEWDTYNIRYRGDIMEGAAVVFAVGFCGTYSQEELARIIATRDGGPCIFWATYDLESDVVQSFSFGGSELTLRSGDEF